VWRSSQNDLAIDGLFEAEAFLAGVGDSVAVIGPMDQLMQDRGADYIDGFV
jgi:hypothetical protein